MWLLGGQGKVLAGNALVGECGGIRAESVWPALGPKLRLAMRRAASVPKRAKPTAGAPRTKQAGPPNLKFVAPRWAPTLLARQHLFGAVVLETHRQTSRLRIERPAECSGRQLRHAELWQ